MTEELTLDQYQNRAARTGNTAVVHGERFLNYTLGLCGEAGEVAEVVKKWYYHSTDFEMPEDKLRAELGDVLWYVSQIAASAGMSLNQVAQANLDKLTERYPKGFEHGKSI